MCDLTICKLSDCSSSVSGGKEIILLCDKITKGKLNATFNLLACLIIIIRHSLYF